MQGRSALRTLTFLLVLAVAFTTGSPSARSVTKEQVNEACADSAEQYAAYEAAQGRFEQAFESYERVRNDIAAVEYQRERVAAIVSRREAEIEDTEGRIEQLAVELYMQGGGPGLVLFADSVDELLTGSEFLSAATEDDLGSLDDMLALRSDLDRFESELADLDADLQALEAERLSHVQDTELAAAAEQEAWSALSERCRRLRGEYEKQLAIARARELARRSSAAGGVGAISGFRCPFPGSSFIDSWGYPRSGGRTHKGTDMFGGWNAPLLAVSNGVVYNGNGGLGGKSVWLIGDNGFAYYYAHLSDWALSSGTRVSAGSVVGYNGDSGNASGGSPHLHFQLHPGGRGSRAVNPYATLINACR